MSPGLNKGRGWALSSHFLFWKRVQAAWLCAGWSGVDDVEVPLGHPRALFATFSGSLISGTAMHVARPPVITPMTLGELHPPPISEKPRGPFQTQGTVVRMED